MTSPRPSISPAGFFCLRTHLLPFDQLVDWSAGLTLPLATRAVHQEALTGDTGLLRSRLAAWIGDPQIREAIFLASPSLEESLPIWEKEPLTDRGQRIERALVKYLARMAARPTPFGLFAGVATGAIAEATALKVAPRSEVVRTTRLDNDYLFRLTAALQRTPAFRAAARYRPNDTVYTTQDSFRYIEARPSKESHTFHLVEIGATSLLHELMAAASLPGGALRATLLELILHHGASGDDANRFADQVIDSQLLLPDLGVGVTGGSPIDAIVARLTSIPELGAEVATLRQAGEAIERLDAPGLTSSTDRYRAIAAGLKAMPVEPDLPRLYQVDLVRPDAGTLGTAVILELERAVDLLHRLTPVGAETQLQSFTRAFMERYQGRSVPLLEALDADSGLGATLGGASDPSPLIAGLPLVDAPSGRVVWGARQAYLLQRSTQVAASGAVEWELTPEDLDALSVTGQSPLPDAGAVIATLAASSETAVARGEFELFVPYVDGPSGARLLGRFCHADPALEDQVLRHLRAEEAMDPDAVFAEIVHLPDGRIGNVICRPHLRTHDITFAGTSGLAADRQIPAPDLVVSVRDGRLELHSARLGRRVVPRLTTAHNYGYGLAAYRFLCMLQGHGRGGPLSWGWGPLEFSAFLPRVRHGRIVLALARWCLGKGEIAALVNGTMTSRVAALQELRKVRRLPRWIALVEGDNRLPVDLDNPLMVDCLLHEIGPERESLLLEELWPEATRLIARGPEGAYRHELVVPFTVSRPAPATRPPVRVPDTTTTGRRFPPGSSWLYLKLYGSTVEADRMLLEQIRPMSRQWIERSQADRWHFLRYGDPEQHLRWRIHGDPLVLRTEIWPAIQEATDGWVRQGSVWRVQVDTYDREVERYGGVEAIPLAETIFFHDSSAVVELLELFEAGDAGLEERWRLALRGADQLLEDFGLSIADRLSLLPHMAGYGSSPSPGSGLRQQLSGKFREKRSSVEGLLDRSRDDTSPLQPGLAVLAERSSRLETPIAALRALHAGGALTADLASIAGSCVHMHLNRLLRDAPNAHETVIYDWLRRIYESRLAREKGRFTPG